MSAWMARMRRRQAAALAEYSGRYPATETRRGRRRLVAAGGAVITVLWAGLVVNALYAPSDLARNLYISIIVVSVVTGVPLFILLNISSRGAVTLGEEHLDERQVAERRKAYETAHVMTTVGLFLLFLLTLNYRWVD